MRKLIFAAAAMMALPAITNAQTIGPDAYGYQITRAATSAFTTIVGQPGDTLITNALGGAAQDDVTFTVPIGFTFNYYGTANTQAFVSTNGFIAMGGNTGSATAGSYANADLSQPTILNGGTGQATVERAVIVPYWDDLYFTNSAAIPGGLHTLTRTVGGVQEFVLEWSGVQYFGATANTVTFQAILRSNGSMQFNYPDTSSGGTQSDGASASIGLHDLNGGGAVNRYLQWGFNTAGSVTSGTTLNVLAPVPEPTSLALVGLGIAGYGWRRLRRKA
jgi:PEP-CTERM motif